jgi:hypothetical protein
VPAPEDADDGVHRFRQTHQGSVALGIGCWVSACGFSVFVRLPAAAASVPSGVCAGGGEISGQTVGRH